MDFFDLTAFAGVCLLISSFFGTLIFRTVFETITSILFLLGLIFCFISVYRFHHSPNEYMFWNSWFWGIIAGLILSAAMWLLERYFFWGSIPHVTHKSLFFAFLYAQIFVLIYGLFLFGIHGTQFYEASVIRVNANTETHTCWSFSCEKNHNGYCFRAIDSNGKCLIKNLSPPEARMIEYQLKNYNGLNINPRSDFIIYFEYGQVGIITQQQKIRLERSLDRSVLKNYLESLMQ